MSDRVPYAKRPDVIERHCTCTWVHWTDDQAENRHQKLMHSRDPECPLHGDHAKEAPY